MTSTWYRCFLLCTLAFTMPLAARAQDAYERGRAAFTAARYDEAVRAFEEAAARQAHRADAHYMLGRIFLETPLADADRAGAAIEAGRAVAPDDVRFDELELLRRHRYPSGILPLYQDLKREGLARRLLKRDAGNAVAHRVLGIAAYQAFDEAFGAVNFAGLQGLVGNADASVGRVGFTLDADVVETPGGASVQFVDRGRSGRRFDTVTLDERTGAYYREALDHLHQAVTADPRILEAYTYLMRAYARRHDYAEALRVLERHETDLADRMDYWLYRGLASFETGALGEASEGFERAFGLMDEAGRAAFQDIASFLPELEQVMYESDPGVYADRFWADRDPRLMTEANERRLEHYARLAYADLRFGDMFEGRRGWETEPGQVAVRYGAPPAEARFSTRQDKYLIFHYGDLEFRFMDLVKAGRYTFYSPHTSAFSGPRNVHREWDHDYAIKGPETFRKVPERFDYDPEGRRIDFPYLSSAFKGEDGQVDLYVPYGLPVPEGASGGTALVEVETAAFAVDRHGAVVPSRRPVGVMDPEQIYTFAGVTLWLDVHRLTVEPGRHDLSVEFEDAAPDGRLGYDRAAFEAPDYEGDALMLSDLMLAYGVEERGEGGRAPGTVVRRNAEIQPAPWGVYPADQPLYLYFELYNLRPGPSGESNYTVEAVLVENRKERAVERLLRGAFRRRNRQGVSVRFEINTAGRDDGQYLILDASGVEPGTYVLALRVTDQVTRETVEQGRTLILE